MTCGVCGHERSLHSLLTSGAVGVCWVDGCYCLGYKSSTLGGSGPESPDRAAPSARSTPAETTVAKPLDEPVATDESPARSRMACAAGSSLEWEDVRDAVDREIRAYSLPRLEHPATLSNYEVGWLASAVARFLNDHPEHRAELLPELDPETTETTW